MPNPPSLTVEITRGSCKIKVRGKRSTRGWDILRVDGARSDHQGHRKSKDDALQFAQDACEPGVTAVFLVQPASK